MIFLEIMAAQSENPAFRELMDSDKFGMYLADLLGLDTARVGMKTQEQVQAYREQVARTMAEERERMMEIEMAKVQRRRRQRSPRPPRPATMNEKDKIRIPHAIVEAFCGKHTRAPTTRRWRRRRRKGQPQFAKRWRPRRNFLDFWRRCIR